MSVDYHYERYAQMALYDFYLKDDVLYILLENDTIALIDTLSKEVISTKELGIDPEFLQSYINDENILMYTQNSLRSSLFFSYRFLENDEDLYILHNMGDSHITSSSNTDP